MTPGAQTDSIVVANSVATLIPGAAPEPLLKIRPGKSKISQDLREAWSHRELLYFLIWRDLKVRYRQTLLGVSWVILQPALMTIVFTIFLSKLGRFSTTELPYPLFAYAGLLPWMFFSNSVSASSSSLISNSYIITKVYFPRLIIPAALVGVRLVDFLVASVVLIGLMAYYGIGASRSLLILPGIVVLSTLFTLAVSAWSSGLHVKYRDLGTLLPVLLQVWMFASPIIYPLSLVPEKWRPLYSLNPLVGIVEGFRASFLGLSFDWRAITIAGVVTVLLLRHALRSYYRWEDGLIDTL